MKTYLALILAIACGGTAAAQEGDDFSFARRLAYRGWFDLAKDVCDRIERDLTIPRDVRTGLPILLAEIELARADREQDPDKALKFISDSVDRLQKFIADQESHPRIFEARINIGYLKARKAKALVDQIEKAKTPEEHDRLRKEAAGLYQEITGDFETNAADWRRLPSSQEVDGAIMDARLEANRARVEHARIPGLADVDRKKLLEDAVKSLVDFEIDYGDTAKAFEAMLLEGQALVELGENAQAETKFKNTLSLREILEREKIARNPYFDQIIFGTYRALAQLYLKTNRAPEAKKFIESVFASDSTVERQWIGPALKVEKYEAHMRLKEFPQAEMVAKDVIESDPNGPFAQLMRQRIGKFGGSGTIKLPPSQALKAAEGLLERSKVRDAMAMLRQAMESSTTDQDRAAFVPQALFLMGQCLMEMRRPYEAAIVYEKVVSQYEKHPLAVKACWEAVVCYSNEFDTFEDPADEKEKDRLMDVLLKKFPGAKEGDNIHYLKALKLENGRKLKEAAESYLQVPERASAFERSLVRGGYCLRVDAFRTYGGLKAGDTAGKQAVIEQLTRAEGIFKKFLQRVESIPSESPEQARDRSQLVIVTYQELAYLYNHDSIGKAAESLAFLEKLAKDISPDDERMAKIHYLQIQSQLVLNKSDEAVKTLELMYDRFEHVKETAQACKSVAIRLDEITSKHIEDLKKKGTTELDDFAKENLKKISRYYGKWLQGAMAFGLNVTVQDVMSVAETLYLTARRLNNIPDSVYSFMDLRKGMIVGWKNYFEEAEFVHGLLVDKFRANVAAKDRITVMMRRARCLSFIADQADGWMRAKQAYEDIVKEFKIVDDKGAFNAAGVIAQPLLVGAYLELGTVYYELGRWNKIHFDNAIKVFSDVASVAGTGGEPWWISRYMSILTHFKRGKDKDILSAQIGIKMLQDNYPDFDGGKYGLKEKFQELQREISGR